MLLRLACTYPLDTRYQAQQPTRQLKGLQEHAQRRVEWDVREIKAFRVGLEHLHGRLPKARDIHSRSTYQEASRAATQAACTVRALASLWYRPAHGGWVDVRFCKSLKCSVCVSSSPHLEVERVRVSEQLADGVLVEPRADAEELAQPHRQHLPGLRLRLRVTVSKLLRQQLGSLQPRTAVRSSQRHHSYTTLSCGQVCFAAPTISDPHVNSVPFPPAWPQTPF